MRKLLPKRLISFVLALTLLLSCVSLTIFAAESPQARATVTDTLLLHRDFDDGKVLTNGISAIVDKTYPNSLYSSTEVLLAESGGNSGQYVNITKTNSSYDPRIQFDFSGYLNGIKANGGSLVVQYDVKTTTDLATLTGGGSYSGATGIITYFRGSNGTHYNLMGIRGGGLSGTKGFYPFGKSSGAVSMNKNTWYTISYVFTFNSANASNVNVTCYINGSQKATTTMSGDALINLCIGLPNTSKSNNSDLGVDNVKFYTTGEKTAANAIAAGNSLTEKNSGLFYDNYAADIPNLSVVSGNMFLKVGAEHGLDNNGVRFTTDEPVKIGGVTYIPLEAVGRYFGLTTTVSGNTVTVYDSSNTYVFTVGSSAWTANGNTEEPLTRAILSVDGEYPVVAAECISAFGIACSEVSSGLIAIGDENAISDSDTTYATQMAIMKRFLFEHIDTSGKQVDNVVTASDVPTSHPYILADADKFAELKAAYTSGSDLVLKSYLEALVDQGRKSYNAIVSKGVTRFVNPYGSSNNGTDYGGRLEESGWYNTYIMDMAFAYQITGDQKYVSATYNLAVQMGTWNHWGPGHFLDVANAAYPYAIAYDWMYNAWTAAGYDVAAITQIIFTHGVLPGYYSAIDNICPWYNPKTNGAYTWNQLETNWNAVCSAGMATAALAIVNESTNVTLSDIQITPIVSGGTKPANTSTTGGTVEAGASYPISSFGTVKNYSTYQDVALLLLNQTIWGLEMYGFAPYVPDGSYLESNGYWSYGTNNLFEAISSIMSATGSDWGLMDAWGIDKTCYYALNIMSSDFQSFNYHDSKVTGAMDTSRFAFVAWALNDSALAGIRKMMVEKGTGGSISLFDAIYYSNTKDYELPELQYHMVGIDGYVVRDSWNSGAIYAGYIGNLNHSSHAQIDSGSFVYYNNGTKWFYDLDTYDYEAYGFGDTAVRYSYYKMSAEGNNTLFLTSRQGSIPYGQALTGFGSITKTGSNAHGAYSVMSQDGVYGDFASSAYRGMLFTNDRKTVVIQDEVSFRSQESAVWVAHTQQQIIISTDGRTAYLYDGNSVLRVTLVTDGADSESLKFEAMDVIDDNDDFDIYSSNPLNTFFLDATVSSTYSAHMGGVDLNTSMNEVAAEGYKTDTNNDLINVKKLVVRCENVTNIKMAVVIEELAFGENQQVGYSWVDMASWTPTADGHQVDLTLSDNDFDENRIGDVIVTDTGISTEIAEIDGNSAMIIAAINAAQKGGMVKFESIPSKVVHGSVGQSYVTFEFDITSDTGYPAGMLIAAANTDGAFASVSVLKCGADVIGKWTHISIVLDTASHYMYVYADNEFVSKTAYSETAGYESLSLAFVMPNGEVAQNARLIVDNVLVRRFAMTGENTSAADELGAILANPSTSFDQWNLADSNPQRGSTPVGAIGNSEYVPDSVTGGNGGSDTPTVNLEAKLYYTFESLRAAIKRGDTVTILADNPGYLLEVDVQCTVINRGYDLAVVSDTLLGHADPSDKDVVTYKTGSTTVTLVTSSGNITATVTNSRLADIDLDFGGARGAVSYSGGIYYIEGGLAADAAGTLTSAKDLVITSANNTFYLNEVPFDGAFVIKVSRNNYLAGYTGEELAQALTTGYTSITLLKDITVPNSAKGASTLGVAITLYLNGHTLTYTGTDNHMVIAGRNVTVDGPGKLVNNSTSMQMFMSTGGVTSITNVVMDGNKTVLDVRSASATLKNCVVNSHNASTLLTLNNRMNAYTTIPTLTLDGCEINSKSYAFQTTFSCVVNVTGGTIINAPHLVCCNNDTSNDTVPTTSTINKLAINIGDCVLNVDGLLRIGSATLTHANYSSFRYSLLSKFKVTGMASVTSDKILTTTTTASGTDYTYTVELSDAALANQNNDSYPYVLAASGKYAVVTWSANGSTDSSDAWAVGSLPVPNATAKGFLSSMTVGDKKGSYPITAVTSAEATAGTKTITANSVTNFDIRMNLTLYVGFNVNFYVEKASGLTKAYFDGVEITKFEDIVIDGKDYYKLTVSDINPSDAAAAHSLTLDVSGGSVTIQVSILTYCRQNLENESLSDEARALIANIVRYIQASYKYFGKAATAEYANVTALANQYKYDITCASVERKDADLSAITDAIKSATLNVTSVTKFRFYLNSAYTGVVTVEYPGTTENSTESLRFAIENGKYNGNDYIEIDIRACNLADDIVIKTAGGTATYSLACYYRFGASELNSDLSLLLNAMYAYAKTAKTYKQTGSLN